MSEPNQPVDGKRDEKREERLRKRHERWNYRVEKIKALTEKALAVAKKRKWLVFLIGAGIAVYFLVSSGSMGGVFNIIKGFF